MACSAVLCAMELFFLRLGLRTHHALGRFVRVCVRVVSELPVGPVQGVAQISVIVAQLDAACIVDGMAHKKQAQQKAKSTLHAKKRKRKRAQLNQNKKKAGTHVAFELGA